MRRSMTACAPFVLFGLSALFSPASGADKLSLSSTNPTALDLDHVVAREKGFYAKENLEVDVQFMQPDLVIKALLAGSVDLARSGTHFGVIAASRGGELKIIGGSNYGYPYEVKPDGACSCAMPTKLRVCNTRRFSPRRNPWRKTVPCSRASCAPSARPCVG